MLYVFIILRFRLGGKDPTSFSHPTDVEVLTIWQGFALGHHNNLERQMVELFQEMLHVVVKFPILIYVFTSLLYKIWLLTFLSMAYPAKFL